MKADSIVTIWHYGESDTPEKRVFKNAHIDAACKIEKNGIKQKGFFDGSGAVVRIATTEDIGTFPGDYLFIGECEDVLPQSDGSLKITEVKDNRRGGQKHWRIVCGG